MRNQLRRHLVAAVRAHSRQARTRAGEPPEFIDAADALLDPDVLTIGFARRMAMYKRMSLIIHDSERAVRLLTNSERPIQFVLAGKAHPFDNEAKRAFQELARWKQPIEHLGRVVYLENYDLALARGLVQGCDVWLNLPQAPARGERHQRPEGDRQRRHQRQRPRRLVGGRVRRRQRLGDR